MAKGIDNNTPPLQHLRVVPASEDTPDRAATVALLKAYSDEEGFHCPKCGVVIDDPDEAVNHLAQEINTALDAVVEQLQKET